VGLNKHKYPLRTKMLNGIGQTIYEIVAYEGDQYIIKDEQSCRLLGGIYESTIDCFKTVVPQVDEEFEKLWV